MIEYWDFYTYGYDASGPMLQGHMSTLPVDDSADTVSKLREVVEEITGEPLPTPPRNPLGFY